MVQYGMPASTDIVCPSCRREMKHFVEESIEDTMHFDGKFYRTFKRLVLSPGSVTRHFEQGRAVPFMKPVQLFIVSNLLFFILVGPSRIFAISLGRYPGSDSWGSCQWAMSFLFLLTLQTYHFFLFDKIIHSF